jgi:hypothetical protein
VVREERIAARHGACGRASNIAAATTDLCEGRIGSGLTTKEFVSDDIEFDLA